jgi:hypothetical protein
MKITLTSDKSKIKRNENYFLTLKSIKEMGLEINSIKLLSNPKEKAIEVRDSNHNIHKAFRWVLEIEMENTQFSEIQLTHPQYDKFIDMWRDSDSEDRFYLNNIHKPKGKNAYLFKIEFLDKLKKENTITPKETDMSKQGALNKLEELTIKVAEKSPKLLEKLQEIKKEIQEVVELPRPVKKIEQLNENETNIEELMKKARLAVMHNKWDTITELEKEDIQKVEAYWREIRKVTHPNDRLAFSKAKMDLQGKTNPLT